MVEPTPGPAPRRLDAQLVSDLRANRPDFENVVRSIHDLTDFLLRSATPDFGVPSPTALHAHGAYSAAVARAKLMYFHRVLVLSHRYWQKRFGGDPAILGRTVRVDGEPFTVVGVLPEGFSDWRHLSWVDAFRPLALDDKESGDRSTTWLRLLGRRAPAVSPVQAAGFVDGFGRRLAKEFPTADRDTTWRNAVTGAMPAANGSSA